MKRIRPGDYQLSQIDQYKFQLEHRQGIKYAITLNIDG